MNRYRQLVFVALAVCSIGAASPLLVTGTAAAEPQNTVQVCAAGGACDNFITKYINPFISLLTVVVGVAAAISIVVAGIQYASAGSDPGKVQKAKDRIGQTLLGLVAYILLFSFLNFIVPGGLF
jgi:hypothetical protein